MALALAASGTATAQTAAPGQVVFAAPAGGATVPSPVEIVYVHTPACEIDHPGQGPYGQNMLPPEVVNVATGKNEMETAPGMGRRIVDSPGAVGLDSVYVTAFEYSGASPIPRQGVQRTERIVMGLPNGTYEVRFTQFIYCAGTSAVLRFTVGPAASGGASGPAPGPGATPPARLPDCFAPNAVGISARDRRILLGIAEDERAAAEFWNEVSNSLDPVYWILGKEAADADDLHTVVDPNSQRELAELATKAGTPLTDLTQTNVEKFVKIFDDAVAAARLKEEGLAATLADEGARAKDLAERVALTEARLRTGERILLGMEKDALRFPGSELIARQILAQRQLVRRLRSQLEIMGTQLTALRKVVKLAGIQHANARAALQGAQALRAQALGKISAFYPPVGSFGGRALGGLMKGLNVLTAAQLAAKWAMISTATASAALKALAAPPKGCPPETPARLASLETPGLPAPALVAHADDRPALAVLDDADHLAFSRLRAAIAGQARGNASLEKLGARRRSPVLLARMEGQLRRLAAARSRLTALRRAAAARLADLPPVTVTVAALAQAPGLSAVADLPSGFVVSPGGQALLGGLAGRRPLQGAAVDAASAFAAGPPTASDATVASTLRRVAASLRRESVRGCRRLSKRARAGCLRLVAAARRTG